MKLVEVISTVLTAPDTPAVLAGLVRELGKTPVQVSDRAGFVANPLLLPYLNHAVHLLETGHAPRDDIDEAATGGLGLPMGPLALLDLIGPDTSLSVLEALQTEFGGSRYAPTPLLRRMVEAGLTGRKSGRGFYEYRGQGAPAAPAEEPGDNPALVPPPATVALIENGAAPQSADLADAIAAAGISVVRHTAPEAGLVIVAAEPGRRVLDAALASGRPADIVGIHLTDKTKPRLAELVITHLTAPGQGSYGGRADRQARVGHGDLPGPAWIPHYGHCLPAAE